jgi:hypothetical protein
MVLQAIIDKFSGFGSLTDLSQETPLSKVGIPEDEGDYAKSYLDVLSEIETGTVYRVSTYQDGSLEKHETVVGIHTHVKNTSDYDPTLVIGPDDGGNGPFVWIAGTGSDPTNITGAGAAGGALQQTGSGDPYIQFPTYATKSDVPDDLPFGGAVAVEGEDDDANRDIYFETST